MDIKGWLAAGTLKLIGALPLGWSRRLGWLFGRAAVLCRSDSLRVSRINLELCYPDMDPAERERLARDSVVSTAMTGCESASLWRQPWRRSAGHIVRVRNRALLSGALDEGRGLLLLAPHTGNWEVFGMYVATLANASGLYSPAKIAAVDPVIRAGRQRTGVRMGPADVRGVRTLVKSLRAGDIAILLPDQEPDPSSGDFAPFFGRPALTMTLAHNLIQRTGCRALFGFGKRVRGGFELVLLPAEEAIYSSEPELSLAALNRGVEACIAEAPAQYQWRYKRFKKRPGGSSRIDNGSRN